MKNKWPFLIVAFLSIQLNLIAQEGVTKTARNAVYLEAAGVGGYGSINYERKFFLIPNQDFKFRVGLSTLNLKDFRNKLNPDLIIPIAINWLPGKHDKKHRVEIGTGQTISNIAAINTNNGEVVRKTTISGTLHIGYRYQKPWGRFLFRCGYTPIFEGYKNFVHWGGVSFGYGF